MEEEDELGVYMRQGPVRRENLNPILWWKEHQEEYPRLSKFALDILAIPAMSVDPERTFSVTKLTISSQRHSLSPEIIEEIQCLRNWLGHQAITVGEVVSFGGDLMGWDGGEAISIQFKLISAGLSLSTLPGIAAYVESRILAFAENITYPSSEKVLSEIGTPNTLSMVLLKTILLLQTSKVSLRDDSLRKEELVEILRGLSDTGPIVKGKASDVDRVMKEAEEKAAKRAEEKAAKEAEKAAAAAVAVAQRIAEAQATEAEAAHEEEELACLLAKKARRGGKLLKKDKERLSELEHNATKRAEARAAREIAEAKTAHALSAPTADKVDLSEPSFTFPTLDVRSSVDRDIPAPDQPHTKNKDESFAEHASSNSPSSNDNDWQYMGISPSSASDGFDLTG
ncbi:hypothetical protein ACKAV7_014568 [Fusarium commune]